MPAIQKIFKRYEIKYLLDAEEYNRVKSAMEEFMTQDIYGLHTICNIYYDTDQFTLIRHSIEKPVYKEKFRVRSYGVPKESDPVFLEIKKKYKGVVSKRRVVTTLNQARKYLQDKEDCIERSQILNEIDYIFQKENLVPKVYIAYDRIAYYGKENPEIRMTIDTNMRYREKDLDLSMGDYGEPILKDKKYLMEIKLPDAMPLWMSHILTKNKIYPISFSKYGTCYKDELIYSNHMESNFNR